MIVTNHMRRAIARLKRGPCLAYDIGAAALAGQWAADTIQKDREAVGRRGARIASRMKAGGLLRSIERRGLTIYGLTQAGDAVET